MRVLSSACFAVSLICTVWSAAWTAGAPLPAPPIPSLLLLSLRFPLVSWVPLAVGRRVHDLSSSLLLHCKMQRNAPLIIYVKFECFCRCLRMSVCRSDGVCCECRAKVLSAFDRVGGDQGMLTLTGLDGNGHTLASSEHQRLLPAKGDQTLLFAGSEVEALCHRRRAGRILGFEHFDSRIGGHDAAPRILHEVFRVLRHRHQAQVAFARTARERGQEMPTGRMLDEGRRLINVERTRPLTVVERLRPHAIGDERDRQGAQLTTHIADIPYDQVAREIH